MANNPQATQQQPALAGTAQLFHTKAQQANAVLKTIGKSLGNPPSGFDTDRNNGRRKLVFEYGEITETKDNATCLADLAVSYTPFSEFIANNKHHWLGKPVEDFYSAQNGAGRRIVVQRYENGVVWWDGQSGPCCLGWHDWHAIAWPGNTGEGLPNPGAFNTFWKDMEKIVLSFVKFSLYVILGIVALLVIIFVCTR